MKKKTWKNWAEDYVRDNGKCPGLTPSFGSPDNMMDKTNFDLSIASANLHDATKCGHYDAVLLPVVPKEMKQVEVKLDPESLLNDVKSMKSDFNEVAESKVIRKLKDALHGYVERIALKDRKLDVPEPLLNMKEYLSKFFEVMD